MNFAETADRYGSELTEQVMPFWMKFGVDMKHGGFLTSLERDGSIYDMTKQMWLQWRGVYMLAALWNHPRFSRPEYLDHARRSFDFLYSRARRSNGDYHYLVTASGAPLADTGGGCEIFTASFGANGCAELFRATGEARYRDECSHLVRRYLESISRAGVPDKRFPARPVRLNFGHYMIGINTLLIVSESLRTREFEAALAEMVRESLRFREPVSGVMFESILSDGSFDLNSPEGRFTNPGHALEGAWFLMEYGRRFQKPEITAAALEICRTSLEYGWDFKSGGIRYFRDFFDKPVLRNDIVLKAWWPQNEGAIASLLAYEQSGDEYFLDFFRRIDAYAWRHFRDPELGGEWFAYAEIDGARQINCKGSRFKGCFHVPRHLVQCEAILRRLEVKK